MHKIPISRRSYFKVLLLDWNLGGREEDYMMISTFTFAGEVNSVFEKRC